MTSEQQQLIYNVQGSLHFQDDGESNESSSEGTENFREDEDEDEEELEVFGSNNQVKVQTKKSNSEPPAKLVNSIVTKVVWEPSHVNISTVVLSKPHSVEPPQIAIVAEEENDEEFGFDENSHEALLNVNQISQAIKKLVEQRTDNPEEINFKAEIEEAILHHQNAPKIEVDTVFDDFIDTRDAFIRSEEPQLLSNSEQFNLKEQAAKALNDIVEVYGSGLGDQGVILDPEDEKLFNAKEATKPKKLTKEITTITEEDDEEEEEDDEIKPVSLSNRDKSVDIGNYQQSVIEDEFDIVMKRPILDDTIIPLIPPSQGSLQGVKSTVTFQEAFQYFSTLDLSGFNSKIVCSEDDVSTTSKSSWKTMLGMQTKKVLDYPNAQQDLKLPFLIAEVDYNPYDSFHLQILNTINHKLRYPGISEESYQQLNAMDDQWEKIGFQGKDPRTDINRSMKMLSLLQVRSMIWVITSFHYSYFSSSYSSSSYLPPHLHRRLCIL
jgi:hypothetical protein